MGERAPRAIEEAPARAKERAVARPMPLEAPVMKTDVPVRERAGSVGDMSGYVSVWIVGVKLEPGVGLAGKSVCVDGTMVKLTVGVYGGAGHNG